MGATTKIGWTDSTVNFWWGCTKVGPGCDHCYAEQWSKKTSKVGISGVGVPRRKIASAEKLIGRLNDRQPGNRVFIQSMSDLFDIEVDLSWFDHAWNCIHAAERLRIQIVTKRVTCIEKRLAAIGDGSWPKHAGLIVTVVNQEEADRDVPRALALKAKLGIPWLGLSIEPQLGPIDLDRHLFSFGITERGGQTVMVAHGGPNWRRDKIGGGIDWVISGGESKQGKDHVPRVYNLAWARSLRDQCAAVGVAYFQKQLGARPVYSFAAGGRWSFSDGGCSPVERVNEVQLKDRQAGADPSEWPADLRVQQFPEALR